jgi:hypothetical protein
MEEVEAVHRCCDAGPAGVADGGHSGGKVDEVHDFAAEDVAEPIGVVGESDLGVLGEGFADWFALHECLGGLAASIAFGVSGGLPGQDVPWRVGEGAGRGGVFEAAVRERMMVALDDPRDGERVAGVAGDGEADGVGAVGVGKLGAGAAGVAEVAERPERGVVWSHDAVGDGAAEAGILVAEREHGVADVGGGGSPLDGKKVGARHLRQVW